MNAILGISAYYHDSAAALLVDGDLVSAAHEERFTRKKHDLAFPSNAVRYVLESQGLSINDVQTVAFYDKPLLKFERLLETYHTIAPKGYKSFTKSMPVWLEEKLFLKKVIINKLSEFGDATVPELLFPEHHLSHAASAFYPSPFRESAILTIDGVGEWATTTISHGNKNNIRLLRQLDFPHSLGLLYSAFTYYCGFRVNSGEYKLMGLAPYGNPAKSLAITKKIKNEIINIKRDGSFSLNLDFFNFMTGLTMTNDSKWEKLFGIPRRVPESDLTEDYMNLALGVQKVTEEIILQMASTAKEITGSRNLVMAGGVALNSVATGKILRAKMFDDFWVQPAAGDAGGAVGAAYACWYIHNNSKRVTDDKDSMYGAYLGPSYSNERIKGTLAKFDAPSKYYSDFSELTRNTAALMSKGKIVGWFQGRMEYGPRALGNRSILGDARDPETQKKLNLKIKYRESFRPFAPSVLEEDVNKYFDIDRPSPYMLIVIPVQEGIRNSLPDGYEGLYLLDKLNVPKSSVPAVTHLDYSARIQTVGKKTNPKYWNLINEFKKITGCSVIVNTSFNVRGEPIVCTPEDAYKCFMRTEMDFLVMGNYLLEKSKQPNLSSTLEQFDLD